MSTTLNARKGNYIRVHADGLDDNTIEQIQGIGNHPAIKGQVAIMPDAHYGKGCVIGFTGFFDKAVIPNLVGVDIGCGVLTAKLPVEFDTGAFDYAGFDAYLKEHIPLGFSKYNLKKDENPKWWTQRGIFHPLFIHQCSIFYSDRGLDAPSEPVEQLGTLGGGNHFIEINSAGDGEAWITIHSGSRRFGYEIAAYFQKKAELICAEMKVDLDKDVAMLPLSGGGREYLTWMVRAQEYASMNRKLMLAVALSYFAVPFADVQEDMIESVHNYIDSVFAGDLGKATIRKGAISAREGERVVIPLNMAAGIIIGTGKGNPDYNYSAPHGAGRNHGRKAMERRLASEEVTMDQFKDSMDHVWSSCVTEKHIDESPMAYKDYDSAIRPYLEATVDVEKIIPPVYNLKG